jgi:hypothetical protein
MKNLSSLKVLLRRLTRLSFAMQCAAATAQDALEMALERQGRQASIAVLHHGGHILPLVND